MQIAQITFIAYAFYIIFPRFHPFSLSKALLFCPFNAQIEISLYISSAFIFPISLNAKAHLPQSLYFLQHEMKTK